MDKSPGKLLRLDQRLTKLPKALQFFGSILLLCICALADYATGREISFSITYLAPIVLATWYAGAMSGISLAIISSIVWMNIDLSSGNVYSHPLIPVWNSLVRLGFFLIVTGLLLSIRKLLRQLQNQAETDGLTGLANSRSFFAHLTQEYNRAQRYRHPFTVAYLDLDNFKQVNDTWGHETGDQVLRTIAGSLTGSLRKTDLVARLGGDEFAVLLTETDAREASEVLGKLHTRLQVDMAEHLWPVGCSIGAVTCLDPQGLNVQGLVRQADELMYRVKRCGKNRLELMVASGKAD